MIPAQEALERLLAGNARYAAGMKLGEQLIKSSAIKETLAEGQEPFAIVLGCSDSRVPAEFVFDQGLGDLFVIRIAGNIVAPSQLASIEFAVTQFKTQLVVVLGHSQCGAVAATIAALRDGLDPEPGEDHLNSIVGRVRPAVEPLMADSAESDPTLLDRAVRANIQNSVTNLTSQSPLLKRCVAEEKLTIVGAEYCLNSGVVSLVD